MAPRRIAAGRQPHLATEGPVALPQQAHQQRKLKARDQGRRQDGRRREGGPDQAQGPEALLAERPQCSGRQGKVIAQSKGQAHQQGLQGRGHPKSKQAGPPAPRPGPIGQGSQADAQQGHRQNHAETIG